MEMASMELAGKQKPPPPANSLAGPASVPPTKQYRPWLQHISPASNGILHIPTNALSQKTLNSLMHGKNVTQMESSLQKPIKQTANKKQHIPPRGLMKSKNEVNETVRAKMRESLAAALALVQQSEESPKGKENVKTGETTVMNVENNSVPVGEGTVTELPTNDVSVDTMMEEATNHPDGLKAQFEEAFPREEVPFTDIMFSTDDLLQGNELSWVLENVSDLGETLVDVKTFQDPEILASNIEMELFKLFDGVNKKYREKGRSLLFNLKDKNNPELRERVMSGEITSERLCAMTAEELASKELSEWRQAKAEKMAEMVVLRDTDVDVRTLVRKTHKGEFQVEIDQVDNVMVDVSAGSSVSRSRRRPTPKSNSAKATVSDKKEKADQAVLGDTPPSTEETDPMQGLAMDDELKDVEFLPPIVSLDEFMESLDSEPPFESPQENSEVQASASEKSDLEFGQDSKSPVAASPKEQSDKESPKPSTEKSDEVSPKSGLSIVLDEVVKTPSGFTNVKGERVWNGILQLSMSSVVPVTGIFKSGEKAETTEWPAMVEVKGRVRLSGFGQFIQELPKSRTRALMIMYFACKDGCSKTQRDSLSEVIDSYVADQRVGYAEPGSGVELYLCPTRGESLDLLTKVVSKDQLDEYKSIDLGFIGVVVWRRAPPVQKVASKRPHSSSSYVSRTSVLPESKKQRVNGTAKPLVVASMENHHHHHHRGYGVKAVEDDGDDVPPGFGPVGSRDDDDLPEFNFNASVAPIQAQSKSLDQVRNLIHKYGNSANVYEDDDDDIPEWQPHVLSHHLPPPPPPPPGFQPDMGFHDHTRTMVRQPQDAWWDQQNGGSGQHYDRNGSRNRGY